MTSLKDKLLEKRIERIASSVLKKISPKKGVDYFDGRDGLNGRDGKDADEDKIIKEVLRRLPVPKDGQDGKDGKDTSFDEEKFLAKVSDIIKAEFNKPGTNKEALAKYGIARLRHGGGDVIYYKDITSQIDGITRVYTLPSNRKVTAINYSSSPFSAWRVTTDYVISGKNNTILTFDNSIPIFPIGQSLTINYIL